MAAVLGKIGKVAAKAMKGAFKSLGKIKTRTWKQMKGAYSELGSLGQSDVFSSIIGFVKSIKELGLIFKPMSALLKVFMHGFMKPFMPLLKALSQILISWIPAFQEAGEAVGNFVLLLGRLVIAIRDGSIAIDYSIGRFDSLQDAIRAFLVGLWNEFAGISGAGETASISINNLDTSMINLDTTLDTNIIKVDKMNTKWEGTNLVLGDTIDLLSIIEDYDIPSLDDGGGGGGDGGDGDGGDGDDWWDPWDVLPFQKGTMDVGPEPVMGILHPHEAVVAADKKDEAFGGKTININIDLRGAVIADAYAEEKLARRLKRIIWEEL